MVRAKLSGDVIRMTRCGHLRAPVFLRLREDEPVDECSIDQLGLKGIEVSKKR